MGGTRVLLTGATGYLGRYLADELRGRDLEVLRASSSGAGVEFGFDLGDGEALAAALRDARVDAVVNCAAMSSMAACQQNPTDAVRINGRAPQVLAGACGVRFLQVSTDLVFAGDAAPYRAAAPLRPLSVYGLSKAEGERLPSGDRLVVRVPLLFGPSFDGRRGATDMLRGAVGRKEKIALFVDEYRTPLHVADAARGIADLLLDSAVRGIRHLGGHERVSRYALAERFCAAVGLDVAEFSAGHSDDPRRPKDVSLVGDWSPGRGLDEALRDC
ncbi:MAG: SDR family oxidoreductase [Planctomycetes bacterium]|nr:SDR family oxidoreductase [Planctomycetota bacterium]MCB9869962.1 SDR family oxidoreductase [Planctomycetota bacterium]